MYEPESLTVDQIRQKRYQDIFDQKGIYYISTLHELQRITPAKLLQRLFPDLPYFDQKPFESGIGYIYRYPLFIQGDKAFREKVMKGAKNIQSTQSTKKEIEELEEQLEKQSEYLKSKLCIIQEALGPWILKWFDVTTSHFHEIEGLKHEINKIAGTINSVWKKMQRGYSEEEFRDYISRQSLPALDNFLKESMCRGYLLFYTTVERSLEVSYNLHLRRMQLAYAQNNKKEQTNMLSEVHGNTKLKEGQLTKFLEKYSTHFKLNSAVFFRNKEELSKPIISQIADHLLNEERDIEIGKRQLSKKISGILNKSPDILK